MGITHAFAADITKAERDSAGDLIVYGKATGSDLDLDEQVCDPAWLKQAMPGWMEWGNLREMHQPVAAGVGLELAEEGGDWMLKSKVVDDGTAKKIEAGALKGYSVGIKNAQIVKDATAPGGRIVGGSIVEVSYVDRPCNPTATLALAKAAGTGTDLKPVEKADASDADPDDDVVVPDDVVDETADTTGDAKTIVINVGGSIRSDRDIMEMVQKALTEREGGWRAKAIDLLKAIGPDGEVDETPDIEGGRQAIALISRLIKAEADELAAGHLEESCDISLLVSAVECLKCWLSREQAADSGADDPYGPVTYVGLNAHADTDAAKRDFSAAERSNAADSGAAMKDGSFPIKTKSDLKNAIRLAGNAKNPAAAKAHIKQRAKALGAEDMIPGSWKDAAPGITKTTGTDGGDAGYVSKGEIGDLVKAAVTEAAAASEERVKALEAELAKVKATPIPGGPVIAATTNRQQPADDVTTKAAYLEEMARQVDDPRAATGYRQQAAELRRQSAAQSH